MPPLTPLPHDTNPKLFAQSIGAIFRLTSAYTASGIEDLFRAVGSKYLDPGYIDSEKKPKSSSTIKTPAQKTNTPKNGSVKQIGRAHV